jgi:hypothetical protein
MADPTPNTPQPAPQLGTAPATWDLVLADIRERDATGAKKYGVRHQHDNGRNHLVDLYQELLDAVVYVRAELEERRTASAPDLVEVARTQAAAANVYRERAERAEAHLDRYDAEATRARNALRDAGIPDTKNTGRNHANPSGLTSMTLERRIHLLAHQRDAALAKVDELTRELSRVTDRAVAAEAMPCDHGVAMSEECPRCEAEVAQQRKLRENAQAALIRLGCLGSGETNLQALWGAIDFAICRLTEGTLATAPANSERVKRFNSTVGAIRGGNDHPDRCVCQRKETGPFADTPHVHYDAAPHQCARCGCPGYEPELPATAPPAPTGADDRSFGLECSGCETQIAEDDVAYCESCLFAETGPLGRLLEVIDGDLGNRFANDEVSSAELVELAVAKVAELREQLANPPKLKCAFCGEIFTKELTAAEIVAHITTCERHPLSDTIERSEKLAEALGVADAYLRKIEYSGGHITGCGALRNRACDCGFEAALRAAGSGTPPTRLTLVDHLPACAEEIRGRLVALRDAVRSTLGDAGSPIQAHALSGSDGTDGVASRWLVEQLDGILRLVPVHHDDQQGGKPVEEERV